VRCGAAGGINITDAAVIADRLKNARAAGYLGILAAHSGQEHVHMPGRDDITFARALADQGEYVYYGHHPHVVQGWEQVGEAHIYYSLGNFVFDDVYTDKSPQPLIKMSEANKTGLIVSLEVADGKVIGHDCVPIYNGDDGFALGGDVEGFSMASYNDYLALPDAEYDALRKSRVDAFIGGRKAKRNLGWYLKRMRPTSAFMILNARRNAKLYQAHFASKLAGLAASDGDNL
jgi:poly-gamma-glutamate synthesis protein (capsule biosynthesis protein)